MANSLLRPTNSRPIPNDFPEDRQSLSKDIDEWLGMAERCLKAYRRLSMNMRQMDQDPLYMKNVVIPGFANNLQARLRLWEMKVEYRALAELWIDLARSLADPAERMKLGLQRARELLQRKLLEEEAAMGSLELQTPRESINMPAQLWQWKNNAPYKEIEQRIHHRRWDYSVQKEGEEGRNKFEEDLQIKKREKLNLGIKPRPEGQAPWR